MCAGEGRGLGLGPNMARTRLHLIGVLVLVVLHVAYADWKVSLQKAVTIHQNGDLAGSTPFYREALTENPELRKNWAVLTNYALAIQADSPAEAAEAFREVISMTPDAADAYYNLGRALTDADDLEAAEEAFGACLQLNPADAEAYYDLAMVQLRQRPAKTDAAVGCVRASIELNPSDGKAWVALGDGLAAQREWAESCDAYREACKLRPQHMPSWSSLGNIQEERGQFQEAEASWRKAISIGSAGASEGGEGGEVDVGLLSGTYQNLGAMLRRNDRWEESRVAYNAAIKLEPSSVEAYMGLGRSGAAPIEGADKGNREYLRYLRDSYGNALQLQPTNAGAYTAIGEGMRMYGLHGGCEEFDGAGALDMYRHALSLLPTNTLSLTHVAFGEREACPAEVTERLMGSAEEASVRVSADGALESLNAEEPTVESLSSQSPQKSASALSEALASWRSNGLAVFPSLLGGKALDSLLEHVRDAQKGNHTADYTAVTRDKNNRCHKALPVSEAREALDAIAQQLQPFFEEALGTSSPALLESGFMVTGPGASGQNWHRDVAPAVVSRSSVTVSVQVSLVDTAVNQGCLEVIPGSQVFDADVSDITRQEVMPKVKLAVPRGTVTVYALHTMHRGTANTHTADRPFYFFTLIGDGLTPPGLAYTIQPDDVGKWQMLERTIQPRVE